MAMSYLYWFMQSPRHCNKRCESSIKAQPTKAPPLYVSLEIQTGLKRTTLTFQQVKRDVVTSHTQPSNPKLGRASYIDICQLICYTDRYIRVLTPKTRHQISVFLQISGVIEPGTFDIAVRVTNHYATTDRYTETYSTPIFPLGVNKNFINRTHTISASYTAYPPFLEY